MVYIFQSDYCQPDNVYEKNEIHILDIRPGMHVLQVEELYKKENDIDHQHVQHSQPELQRA